MKHEEYVIIGNGVAAAGCIEGIRTRGQDGARSPCCPRRAALRLLPAADFLSAGGQDRPWSACSTGRRDFYEKNGCHRPAGAARRTSGRDGTPWCSTAAQRLPFDRLLVATGSSPIVPPVPGLDGEYYTFMTLDEALRLEAALTKDEPRADCRRGPDRPQMRWRASPRAWAKSPCADLRRRGCCPACWTTDAAARMQAASGSASGAELPAGRQSLARVWTGIPRVCDERQAKWSSTCWCWPWACGPTRRSCARLAARCDRGIAGGRRHAHLPCRTCTPPATAREARDVTTGQDGACWRCCPTPTCRATAPAYVWRAAARRLIRRFR